MSLQFLGNFRWLTISSNQFGQDWIEKSMIIDQQIEKLGFDLAEDTIALIFQSPPKEIIQGKGLCLIGRPVIGPKRSDIGPFKLIDWASEKCQTYDLSNLIWKDVYLSAVKLWEELRKTEDTVREDFVVLLKRRMRPELTHSVEVLFWLQ